MHRRSFLALSAGAVLAQPLWAEAQGPIVQHVGTYVWKTEDKRLGGFSGMLLASNGQRAILVGDTSAIIPVVLQRDDQGVINGVDMGVPFMAKGPDGERMWGQQADLEGIAMDTHGRIYMSFERDHRVMAYEAIDGPATEIAQHPDFVKQLNNSGLEALAVDGSDRVYAISERSGSLVRDFPVYRLEDGAWKIPFTIPRRGNFVPVGADFGPDGKLYLLERLLTGTFGFRSRVRRFDVDGDVVANEVQLLVSRTREHDNLEGICVWRDGADTLRITMVSDNNFNRLQHNEFVEYRVTERLDPSG